MPNKHILLRDSLERLTQLKTLEDSLRLSKQSAISYWFDQMLSPELSFQFFESLLLILLGGLFAYLLYHRSKRIKNTDRLQAHALTYAALAVMLGFQRHLFSAFIFCTIWHSTGKQLWSALLAWLADFAAVVCLLLIYVCYRFYTLQKEL
jgi:hypothetical protein